jgi:hypothetical protein
MGFVSKVCAKSNLPVVHDQRGYDCFNRVVALLPNGDIVKGSYDGYARVDGVNLQNHWEYVKLVLEQHYNGESYNDLPRSGSELGQGHFMHNDFLLYCKMIKPKGFKNYGGYKRAFEKYAQW